MLIRGDDPAGNRRWADGISESIASKLTQITTLRIAPWITSSRFSAEDIALPKLAEELNVDTLLIGSYERIGPRLRGYLDLVDVHTGLKIWNHEFDEPFADILDLQSRLALQVAQSLKGRLSGEERTELERPVSKSVEAYSFYRLGVEQLRKETHAANAVAIDYFEKALDLDPALAEAHNGLGAAYHQRIWRSWAGGMRNDEQARHHFERALQLDPGLLAARSGLILTLLTNDRRRECLEQARLVAGSGRDDAEANFAQGLGYYVGGLPSLGIPFLERTLELDPANQGARFHLVAANLWASRYDEAVIAGQSYLRRFPDEHEIRLWMANALHRLGRLRQARGQYERALALGSDDPNMGLHAGAAHFYFDMGDSSRARQILHEGIAVYEARVRAFPETVRTYHWLAILYAMLGERDDFERCLRSDPANVFRPIDYRGYAYLGDYDQATATLRSLWDRGGFSELVLADLLPKPTPHGQLPGLEPLAEEAFAIRDRLLREYAPPNLKPGEVQGKVW